MPETTAPRGRRFTLARVLAAGALVAGIALVFVVLFADGGGRQYKLLFETGGQLVPGNEVLVAGQPIGTVDSLEGRPSGRPFFVPADRRGRPTGHV